MTRREVIVQLLLRYEEAAGGTRAGAGDPDAYPHMPSPWNAPGYRELRRCLVQLSRWDHRAYMALKGRYVWPQRKVIRELRQRSGRLERRTGWPRRWVALDPSWQVIVGTPRADIGTDCVCIRVAPWIDPALVEAALDYLERTYRGEPCLPLEFIRAEPVGSAAERRYTRGQPSRGAPKTSPAHGTAGTPQPTSAAIGAA